MHMRNAVLIAILIAVISALSWALNLLSQSMEFGAFMLFCAATFAFMVGAGFAWDHYADSQDRSVPR